MEHLPNELVEFTRLDHIPESESPKSLFSIPNSDYQQEISGAVLEACFSLNLGYLVITSDDCIFENALNILLLNTQLDLIDQVCIGLPYATGIFKLIALKSSTQIIFEFFKNEPYILTLLDQPEWSFPFISEAPEVSRRFGLKRHFKIAPLPQF